MDKKFANIFNNIEEKIILSLDLLEIAKSHCECHVGESSCTVPVATLLGVVIKEQKELVDMIDDLE